MAADVLDCIHGVDLLRACAACQQLVDQVTQEYEMQTSGTFPELNKKQAGTKKAGGKKAGGKRGC